jgi:hypothetical protein
VRYAAQFGSAWKATGDDTWIFPFVDAAYGSTFSAGQSGLWGPGKNAGYGYVTLGDNAPPPAQVAAPAFNPGGGTYTSAQSVTITSATSGATIRYTTNGTTPSQTNGTVYSAPVSIAATTTLKAIAYKSGMTDSTVTSATYTISGGGGGTFNLTTTADTYAYGGNASANMNGDPYIRLKDGSGTSNDRWAYVKFDLSSVTGAVQTAVLKVKVSGLVNGTPGKVFVYSCNTDSWTETGLTWNHKPAVATLLTSNTNVTTVNTVLTFDVKTFVSAQLAGDKIVTLVLRDDTQAKKTVDFYRREDGAANAATLTIVTQ